MASNRLEQRLHTHTHTHTYTLEHCTLTLLRTSHRSALGVCFLAWERETHTALREMCLTEAQQRERQLSWVLFPSHSSISCCFLIERHTRCLLDDCCLSCGVSHYLAWRSVWRKTPICVCVCVYVIACLQWCLCQAQLFFPLYVMPHADSKSFPFSIPLS